MFELPIKPSNLLFVTVHSTIFLFGYTHIMNRRIAFNTVVRVTLNTSDKEKKLAEGIDGRLVYGKDLSVSRNGEQNLVECLVQHESEVWGGDGEGWRR